MNKNIKLLTNGAVIAALYTVLTLLSNALGLASGAIQLRISEALTILPAFTPAAPLGLFIGCLISNIICGSMLPDVIFGSLATLIGALGTYYFAKNKFIASAFPIIANTATVPLILKYVYKISGPLWYFILTVGIGEVISCGVFGVILYSALEKRNIFKTHI